MTDRGPTGHKAALGAARRSVGLAAELGPRLDAGFGRALTSRIMATLVFEVLAETAAKYGSRPAFRAKRNGAWQTTTWKEYATDARRVAKALMKLGVTKGEGVSLLGQNSPEWLIADLGAIHAGAMPAGIYTTSSPAQVAYVTAHCEARVAFADTPEQVAKLVAEKERLPKLEVVVQMLGLPATSGGDTALRVLSWRELLALGDELPDAALEARMAEQRPDDVCTLIYTSGTTGEPKAVMITHTNCVWTAGTALDTLDFTPDDVTLSYLPLSHVAEQILTIHGPMKVGSLVYFVESVEKLGEALPEVRPTLFMGVPRVWEKIQARMQAAGASGPPLRKKLVAWARRVGLAGGLAEQRGAKKPLLYPVAKRLVFDAVRKRLGLDRCRVCVTAAAPISRDTLDFFLALGIPLLEVYGMSECTGPATVSLPERYRTGTCGRRLPGTELVIASDGEVLMRGKHVFKGYLKDAEATKEALDDEGWLHSGDIGAIDVDGFLRITDRKKDLLITAGGENIAPQLLEGHLKSIPIIQHAVVVGDRRKYVAALLTLDPERVAAEAAVAGSPARTAEDAATCEIFRGHVDRQIASVNDKLARVQTIKRFAILPCEFTIDGGELTPTMKLKRKAVNAKYKREIEALYPPDGS
ncbi:MAG: Long-chain-fatty-acid--CoA ligase [Labilithrix sp.]|nr:Long-chain-fatty-acid--CoA ligase [Labilithrix sp.]